MTTSELRKVLVGIVKGALPDVPVQRSDEVKALVRPSLRIDLFPVTSGIACRDARERSVDVDVWYYAKDTVHPRDECDAVAEALMSTLEGGFEVGGIWVEPDEDIRCEPEGDVLGIQLAVSWCEYAPETGELMEELEVSGV